MTLSHRAIAGAIVLMAALAASIVPSGGAFAVTIGSLVPPVQWQATGPVLRIKPDDVAALGWKQIYGMLPSGGGTIELAPGKYPDLRAWNKPGLLVVRGRSTTRRPVIGNGTGCGGSKNDWSGFVVSGVNFRDITSEIASQPKCDFFRLENVTVEGCDKNGIHLSNSDRLRFEMENVTVSECGRANMQHNVYIGRIVSALIVGLTSHSARGSHALKAIARDIELRDSWLGTVAPGQTIQPGDDNPFVSTTLADLVACGRTLIDNVTFDHVAYDGPAGDARDTGNQVLSFRARNSILGCDDPPYGEVTLYDSLVEVPPADAILLEPVGDNKFITDRYYATIDPDPVFWSDSFWANDPGSFLHRVVNSTFIERGQPDRALAIKDEGTQPEIASRPFGPALRLPTPDGWFERSRVTCNGCVFEGSFRDTLVPAPASTGATLSSARLADGLSAFAAVPEPWTTGLLAAAIGIALVVRPRGPMARKVCRS